MSAFGWREEMRLSPVCHAVHIANSSEEEILRLSGGKTVLRLERLRYAGGNMRAFERSVLPFHRVQGIQAGRAQHLSLKEIAEESGLELGTALERLSISHPPPAVAFRLSVSPKQHLLKIDRITSTVDEVPIEWRVVYAMQMSS
jgi:DNA-binding GntR family transcriptional regulator